MEINPAAGPPPEAKADHRHLASDGKTLRATSKQAHPVHQLSCYEVSTARVLWHGNVQEKHNEISERETLLDHRHGERAHSQPRRVSLPNGSFVRRSSGFCGDSVLFAKDNQPTLKEDSADLFEDRTPDRRRWQEKDDVGERTWALGTPPNCLSPGFERLVCQPVARYSRRSFASNARSACSKPERSTTRWSTGWRSLSLSEAPAPRMLALVRDHWAIEKRLHYRRDVTRGEDACQTRSGSPPSLLAQLNSAVLSLMDRIGVRNGARQRRFFDAEYDQALDLVLTGHCSVY